MCSMCSLVVSVLDSPAVDPRLSPGSGSASDALSSNRKVDGSRLTGSTQACHSRYGSKNTGDGIASVHN